GWWRHPRAARRCTSGSRTVGRTPFRKRRRLPPLPDARYERVGPPRRSCRPRGRLAEFAFPGAGIACAELPAARFESVVAVTEPAEVREAGWSAEGVVVDV